MTNERRVLELEKAMTRQVIDQALIDVPLAVVARMQAEMVMRNSVAIGLLQWEGEAWKRDDDGDKPCSVEDADWYRIRVKAVR